MKIRSLTRRILVIVLAAQILCAAILCAFALLHERHTRLKAFDETLRGRSDSLLGAIQDAEDPADSVKLDPAELRLPPEDIFAVYYQGMILGGSSVSSEAFLLANQTRGFRERRVGNETYRVFQRDAVRIIDRAENGGVGLTRPVTIVYAAPESHLRHEVFEATFYYVLLILAVVAATGMSVLLLLSRALRPLLDFASAASRLSVPALNFSVPQSVLAVSELRPLASALGRVIDELREAFKKEKQFVEDAAHELKTAVAVARSTIQVLTLKPRSVAEHTAGLSRALEDVTRIESLIAQMLSSASLGDTPAVLEVLNLAEIAASTLLALDSVAAARGIRLDFHSNGKTFVTMQSERAKALCSNLVMNALQHSSAGMRVALRVVGDDHGNVSLLVKDTGRGIGAEALPHVFDRFYREDESRSRDTGGAGLGLSICRSIVEAAGGKISIKSEPSRGTEVTVLFSRD